MEALPSKFQTLGKDITKHILKFFSFSQICQLFYVSSQFAQFQNDSDFNQILLQQQFGVPANKKADFKQYYLFFKKTVKRIQKAYEMSPHINYNIAAIQHQFYSKIRKQQIKYQNNDIDIRFLMARSLSALVPDRFIFGGIVYYHQREFYMSFKDEQIELEGLPLYPQVMLEDNVVLADFDNKLGLGSDQRYLLTAIQDNSWTVIRWNQNYFDMGKQRQGAYLDYFDTLDNPKSDCTTRGVRIRTDARLISSDERFSIQAPFFSYQIRFSDNGSSQKGAKLVSRRWIIKQYGEDGALLNTQVVQGDGVIGYYPHIKKGCKDFLYESCCGINSVKGSMEGHFIFEDLETKERFPVQIKPFDLNFGPHVAYSINRQTLKVQQLR